MRDVLDEVARWWDDGVPCAVATVVATWRSSPSQPGAAMALTDAGEPVGSVSGGCVEGAVYELGEQVLVSGRPVLQRYGISDADAFSVGLTCGGIIDVFVERVDATTFSELPAVERSVRAHEAVAVATVINGQGNIGAHRAVWADRAAGSVGPEALDAAITDMTRTMLKQGTTGVLCVGAQGEPEQDDLTVFVQSYVPAPRMLVFGAIDFAVAMVRIGKFLGYRVTVCDARGRFATPKRFPEADEIAVEWPHRYLERADVDARTVICVLTHDSKFDVPLLTAAVRTDAAYIGAMGSRRTHEDRLARLRDEGVSENELARICAPIGLDLGAHTPEETAVAIAAEIVALRTGATGQRLTVTAGPIHNDCRGPLGSAGSTTGTP